MAWAVAANARGEVHPTAGLAGQADGVLHGAIGQPARVAPVQPLAPGLEELVEGGEHGALLLARSLGFMEVEPVLPAGRLVGEDDAWGRTRCSAGSVGSPPAPSPAPAGAGGVPNPSQIQLWDRDQAMVRRAGTGLMRPQQRIASDIWWHKDRGAGDTRTTLVGTHRDAQTVITRTQGSPPHRCMDHGPGDIQTVVPGRHGPPPWGWRDHCHGDAQATGTGTQGPASRGYMGQDHRDIWARLIGAQGPPTWGWRDHHHGDEQTTGTCAPPPPRTTVTVTSGDKPPKEGEPRGQGGRQGQSKADISPALSLAVEPGLGQVPHGK